MGTDSIVPLSQQEKRRMQNRIAQRNSRHRRKASQADRCSQRRAPNLCSQCQVELSQNGSQADSDEPESIHVLIPKDTPSTALAVALPTPGATASGRTPVVDLYGDVMDSFEMSSLYDEQTQTAFDFHTLNPKEVQPVINIPQDTQELLDIHSTQDVLLSDIGVVHMPDSQTKNVLQPGQNETAEQRITPTKKPLHLGAERANHKILEMLLRGGANVDAVDGDGRTALHVGAMLGHDEVVRVLLRNKADTSIVDKFGMTVMCTAVEHDRESVVLLLLEAGLNPDS
ncbi:Ankyrin repeat-containing domain protein [Naviculisporaceae sp. PSN 640]